MKSLKEKIALAIFNAELSKNDVFDLTGDYKSLWIDCLDYANDSIKNKIKNNPVSKLKENEPLCIRKVANGFEASPMFSGGPSSDDKIYVFESLDRLNEFIRSHYSE